MKITPLSKSLDELKKDLENFKFVHKSADETVLGTYQIAPYRDSLLSAKDNPASNRHQAGWKKGQIVIAKIGNNDKDEPIAEYLEGWKTVVEGYKDQILCLETVKDEWRFFDYSGNEIQYSEIPKLSKPILMPIQSTLPLSKPFLILAGISGTGKSRFVREQAQKSGGAFELVAVRPDWHEPSDLLGYVSRLSGQAEYVATPVLRFITQAWLTAIQNGVSMSSDNGYTIATLPNELNIPPYWLCLDEMNLAPVEQYFADYLAVLETREFDGNQYRCLPLLSSTILQQLDNKAQTKLANDLGLDLNESSHKELWQFFQEFGIALPFNLIVAGTVNMDETTHGFSRKVIDRAITWDFGEFFPNDFTQYFNKKSEIVALSYPIISSLKREDISQVLVDSDGQVSIGFLNAVKSVLKDTPFEPAFRALNELMLSVYLTCPDKMEDLQAVWDDFLMTKILPRIEGDYDKLTNLDGQSILDELEECLKVQLKDIWDTQRKDFFRIDLDSQENLLIECRSKHKLQQMKQRLATQSFCHFWS